MPTSSLLSNTPSATARPHSRLVQHDIRFDLVRSADGRHRLVALVDCERRGCTMRVDDCRYCERFAHIDVHEAGYTMACRSTDERRESLCTSFASPAE